MLMTNHGIIFWLCSINLYCCSKHKLSTILVHFVTLTFSFKTLFKLFSVSHLSAYIIYDCIIDIMGYSKHELSTINMLYSLKKFCHITPLPPHNGPLSTYNSHILLPPKVAIVERFNNCIIKLFWWLILF